jgi:hypothetical protein
MRSNGIRWAAAFLIGAGLLVASAPASAQGALPVHLTFDAPAGCPGEEDFIAMIAQAGGRLVQVPEEQAVRSFVLQVTGTSPARGRLVIREGNGREAVRELNDSRCDAVVRAAAVVVALSLDAPITMTPPPPPLDAAEPPAESLEPLPPVPGIAAGVVPPGEPQPDRYGLLDDESPAAPPIRRRWRFDVSVEGVYGTGAKPAMNAGFAAYAELLQESPTLFAPSVRVGFQVDNNQGSSDLVVVRRTVGRIDACPLRGVLARPWSSDAFTLQLCARVDIGKMDVVTWSQQRQVDLPQLWLATAGLLRLRWMSPSLFVELEGGVVVPLVRPFFRFGQNPYPDDPNDFGTPVLAGTAGLGGGVFFM